MMQENDWCVPDDPERYMPPDKALGSSVRSLIDALSPDGAARKAAELATVWEYVADQTVLTHTGSVFIDHSRGQRDLVVLVDGPMMAADLNARGFMYLMRVNKEIADHHPRMNQVASIRFKVSRSVSKRRQFESRTRQQPDYLEPVRLVGLSEKEEADIDEMVSSLPDEKLKKAAQKAIKADLNWKKSLRASKRSQSPLKGSTEAYKTGE